MGGNITIASRRSVSDVLRYVERFQRCVLQMVESLGFQGFSE